MITLEIYAALVLVVIATFVYTFVDLRNRLYGNIISCFVCGIISFVVSLFSVSGDLVLKDPAIAYTTTNISGGNTLTYYFYSDLTIVQNLTLLFLFAFIGCVMCVFGGYLILEAYYEKSTPLYAGGDICGEEG